MTVSTQHRYIVQDSRVLDGEPIIEATRTPVRAIIELWRDRELCRKTFQIVCLISV